MPMKSAHGSDAPSLACYCEKHLTVCPHEPGTLFDVTNPKLSRVNNKRSGIRLSRSNVRSPISPIPPSQPVHTRQPTLPALPSSPL